MKSLKKGIISLCASALLFSSFAVAEPIQQKGLSKSNQLIGSAGERSTSQIRQNEVQKLLKEAIEVVVETNKTLFYLQQKDINKAKEHLEIVKKKLASLEKNYKVKKFPVDVVVSEIKGDFDLKTAQKLAKEAKEAVEENNFVKARFILNSLRDEIVIQTAYLPLDLYKQAIELADKFLKEKKIDNAISQLQIALGTIEIETVIIPRPLAIASLLVEDASKIYKKDEKTALQLLEEARKQIKLAQILGYVRSEREIKPLIEEIDKLEEAIRNKQKNSKDIFRRLIEKIKEMGKGQSEEGK